MPDPRLWRVVALALAALVFAVDLLTPNHLAIPIFYVVPTMLFVGAAGFAEPLVVAALATALTAAGYVYPEPPPPGADGTTRLLAVTAVWITAALVAGSVRIVNAWTRKLTTANRALQVSMHRLQDLEQALDQSVIVAATDQTGRITFVNDKFCQISQYSRQELVGQDHRLINSGHHPPEYIRELWRTIANGHVWHGELCNRAKDGSLYWVDTTIVPFLNERGMPWQYLSIRCDVTQRKLAEQKIRDEAALTQLGQLSAVVAHEVRNPLAALRGSLQVLAKRLPPDLPGREVVGPMLARIDALNQTVKDILTYSKPSPPRLQRVDILRVLQDVATASRATLPGALVNVRADSAMVVADPEMTRAALINLVVNACQADPGRPIDVEAICRDGHCTIRVLDRGPGLPSAIREHLFEPFKTSRSGGTGLGLPIAKRLVTLQGGTLTIEDRPGGGTIAAVSLAIERAPTAQPSIPV